MQINPGNLAGTAVTKGSAVTLGAEWRGGFGSGPGPLSEKEIKMITEVTGMEFHWPPRDGNDGYPGLASEIANAHWQQLTSGAKIAEFTSAAMLSKLHGLGGISAAELTKALDYVKTNPDTSSTAARRSAIQPGTVAADGSVYL